jgi:GTPase involved in cell partitioning and DNA repair
VAHKRVGPPNGGDGGPGGDVIVKAINSEPNLRHLKSFYGGGSGGSGGKDKKYV